MIEPITIFVTGGRNCATYSCVHNQIATFGLLGRQSVTLNIGLNIGCTHNRDNRPSEQSAKCNIGQALISPPISEFFYFFGLHGKFAQFDLFQQNLPTPISLFQLIFPLFWEIFLPPFLQNFPLDLQN